jgi:D-amino-acid dehydrogenase
MNMTPTAADADTAVIGAGLIGLTTAWELASRGERVELIEAREHVALETSHANGGLLTGMADPWNSPGVHRHLFASLWNPHAAMQLRWSALPSLLTWGTKFLRNSSAERYWRATQANHLLSAYSIRATRALRERLGLHYDASTFGSLKVFRDLAAMAGPIALVEKMRELGFRHRVLNRDATVQMEPQLAAVEKHIVGALYFPDDEGGDAYAFCRALAEKVAQSGVPLRTGVTVDKILARAGRVELLTNEGIREYRRVVVAGGVASTRLLGPLGVRLPVRPVKGYSLTIDALDDPQMPRMPVVDDAMHAALVPLGSRLRIAGTAEFAGHDRTLNPQRVNNLVGLFAAVYPQIAARIDRRSIRPWTGLRPMSADGVPFIGATRVPGVYANAGHGYLGWTMALGSARLLADAMLGTKPEIDPHPYRIDR